VHITTNLVHQIQAGSASPSTFAVHLEEYLRPLGCSEFSGGKVFIALSEKSLAAPNANATAPANMASKY